jgi:hypothetical protein
MNFLSPFRRLFPMTSQGHLNPTKRLLYPDPELVEGLSYTSNTYRLNIRIPHTLPFDTGLPQDYPALSD